MKKLKRPFKGSYPVTQTWGVNPGLYTRFGLKGHNGVDYGTPYGTPILAPHDGKILEVYNDKNGYGLYVKIENDKEGSILAHLTQHDVRVGQDVRQGDRVGLSGNTGFSTGPHLHWGYYRKPRNRNDGFSGTINPYPYLTGDDPVDHSNTNSNNTMTEEREKKIQNYDKLARYNSYYAELNEQADRVINDLRGRQGELESKNKQIEELSSANNELDKTIRIQGEELTRRKKEIKELKMKVLDEQGQARKHMERATELIDINKSLQDELKLLVKKNKQLESVRDEVAHYQEALKICQARTEPTTWLGKVLYDLAYGRRPRIWTQQQ